MTYSQFGEDITAQNLLRNVQSGFYVDVGAHHPLRHSNTAALHILGWQGVTVEPVRAQHEAFTRMRPHATNLRAAIHNDHDSVTIYKFRKGLANTIIPERGRELAETHDAQGEETVPALSLNDLFERHVPADTHVNYLTVDIEGYDVPAILAFDLDRHRPDVICVEIYRPDMLALGQDPVVRHLTDHGYQLYAINIFSFTFVDVEAAAGRLGVGRAVRLHEASTS